MARNRRRTATRRDVPTPHPTVERGWLLPALLIALAGCLVYANSLDGPFLFDDRRAIVDNESIRQLWPLTEVLRPPAQSPVTGRPLANLTFAINYAFGGLEVSGYHVWNIAMHVLAALVLLGVLRRTLTWLDAGGLSQGAGARMAAACALVWAVHPLNTEAVNYLTQRTETLVSLFYLLTLYASMRAWEERRRSFWMAVAVVFNLCGVASKESMVTAPLMIVLADRVFHYGSFRAAFRDRGVFYTALAAGWILFAIQSLETPFFQEDGFELQTSRWNYLLNQAPLVVSYLRLSIWPRNLIFDYGVARELTVADVWIPALVVLALLALTVIAWIRVPRVGFWGAWFFVTLAPASSLIPIPTEAGAERRMYLPLVAVIVLTGVFVRWLGRNAVAFLERRGLTLIAPATRRAVAVGAFGLVVLFLAFSTIQRNREYQTGLSIWQSVIDRHPHPRAHSNLAVQLRDAGRDAEAVEHLKLAAPDWPDAKLPLGSALRERGEMTEAIAQLRDFIRLKPSSPDLLAARMELATALTAIGDTRGAIAELESIVASAPESPGARHALADLFFSSGDFTRAAAEYREYLRLQPKNEIVQIRLGLALAAGGDRAGAIESYRRALAIQPRNVAARRGLLDALHQERRFAELELEARATLELNDTDWSLHNMLGIALASQRRFEEAAQAFAEAVRLNPESREARENLRQAMALRQRAAPGAR